MALAINSQMTSNTGQGVTGNPTSPFAYNFVNTAGTLLYVWVLFGATTVTATPSSVTYGGTAMSFIKEATENSGNGRIRLYRLLTPATGTNSVSMAWSGTATDIISGAISFTGNNTSAPEAQTNSASNDAGSGTASVSLSGVTAGNITIAAAGCGSAMTAQTQTLDWAENADSNTYMGNGRASTSTASGTVTHSYTVNGSDTWACIICEVAAAGTGSPPNPIPFVAMSPIISY